MLYADMGFNSIKYDRFSVAVLLQESLHVVGDHREEELIKSGILLRVSARDFFYSSSKDISIMLGYQERDLEYGSDLIHHLSNSYDRVHLVDLVFEYLLDIALEEDSLLFEESSKVFSLHYVVGVNEKCIG